MACANFSNLARKTTAFVASSGDGSRTKTGRLVREELLVRSAGSLDTLGGWGCWTSSCTGFFICIEIFVCWTAVMNIVLWCQMRRKHTLSVPAIRDGALLRRRFERGLRLWDVNDSGEESSPYPEKIIGDECAGVVSDVGLMSPYKWSSTA